MKKLDSLYREVLGTAKGKMLLVALKEVHGAERADLDNVNATFYSLGKKDLIDEMVEAVYGLDPEKYTVDSIDKIESLNIYNDEV